MTDFLHDFDIVKVNMPFKQMNTDYMNRLYEITFNQSINIEKDSVISRLKRIEFIEYVEQIPIMYNYTDFCQNPNDPEFDELYYFELINSAQACEFYYPNYETRPRTVVGIVELYGVFIYHNDLINNANELHCNANSIIDGVCYDNNPNPAIEDLETNAANIFSHGAHVAGIAGAETNNNLGVASIGWNNYIMGVKCSTNGTTLFSGIDWAVRNGAKNYPYKYLDSLKNKIDSLSFVKEDIRQNLDNGKTQELLNDIYGNMPNGRLKNKLITNSPLSDTVLYALMSEYPLSHGNFKNVMTINLPVSKNLTSLFYNVMAQIPQGISKQLIPLQGVNFNYQNITSLNGEIEHLNLERGFVLNQLLNRLTDNVNNRRDDALLLLELENTDWAKATLVASYIEDGQYSHAREKLLQIQSIDPLAQDFIDYQNMMLDIYEDNRTVYQMDSTEIAFIRELAYKCPAGIASTNAQAILSLLYRENVPICPMMVGTKSIRINNNNNINDDKYNKPILDIILGDNYPDPASDYTIIPYYLPEDTDGIMEIYDAMGKVIAIYNLYQGDNQLNIDTKNLHPGIYTYTLITKEHGTISKKFIIYK